MLARVNNRVSETIAQSWIILKRVYCTCVMRGRVWSEGVSSEQIHHNNRYGNRDLLMRIKENWRSIVDIGRTVASSLARLVWEGNSCMIVPCYLSCMCIHTVHSGQRFCPVSVWGINIPCRDNSPWTASARGIDEDRHHRRFELLRGYLEVLRCTWGVVC